MSDAPFSGQSADDEVEKPLRTKTGKILTDEDIQRLADEAEAGYDPAVLLAQRQRPPFDELNELRRIGDQMQSEADRLVEFSENVPMPYEVYQAWAGLKSAIKEWTEVRRETRLG